MKEKKAAATTEKSSVKELKPWPSYIQERLTLWDNLKAAYDADLANKPQNPIKVTLPDGKIVEGVSWKTNAYDIAKSIRYNL